MESKDQENVSLKNILVKYFHHWKLFLAAFVLSFIPAILYLSLTPRTYKFIAGVLLQDEMDSGISSIGMGEAASLMKSFGVGGMESSFRMDDEMEILMSNRMFRMMISDLGLNVSYSKPFSLYKMYREAPLRLTVDQAAMAGLQDEFRFNVSVTPEQIRVKVRSWMGGLKQTFTFSSLPAVINTGQNEFMLDFDHNGSQNKPFKLNIKVQPAGWMAETLSNNITIEDVSNSSNVLMLSCSDHSRQRGMDMLTALINVYNEDSETYKLLEADKTMTFVNSRIAEIVTELEKVETGLQDFKVKNDMTLLEADVSLYGDIFKDTKVALTEAEMKSYTIDLLDNYVNNPENQNKPIPSVFSVEEGEKGVISQYNKAIVYSEKLLMNSNERNFIYQQAKREADVLRESVNAMIANARSSISKELEELKSREKQMMAKFKSVPENEREYIGFIRDQEILHGIYLLMLQKREETIISQGKKLDRARMIEPPYIKKKPLGPRKLFAAIGMLVITFVVPVGYLFTKELFISIRDEYRRV